MLVLSWALTAEALPISLLAVCPGVPHPHSRYLGQLREWYRAPHPAVPWAGSSGRTWSLFFGHLPQATRKEGAGSLPA